MATAPGQEFASWRNVPRASDSNGGLGGMLLAMGISSSGLEKQLNDWGVSKNEKGQWGYKAPQGAVVPTEGQAGFVGPIAPPDAIQALQPYAQPPAIQPVVQSNTQFNPTIPATTINPIGQQILNNTYKAPDINPQATRDIPVSFDNNNQAPVAQIPQMPQSSGVGKMLASMMFA